MNDRVKPFKPVNADDRPDDPLVEELRELGRWLDGLSFPGTAWTKPEEEVSRKRYVAIQWVLSAAAVAAAIFFAILLNCPSPEGQTSMPRTVLEKKAPATFFQGVSRQPISISLKFRVPVTSFLSVALPPQRSLSFVIPTKFHVSRKISNQKADVFKVPRIHCSLKSL